MDGFQAAILSVKLKYLDKWNESRRKCAGLYRELLEDVKAVSLPMFAELTEEQVRRVCEEMKNFINNK
jgi:dTDP-4-amino-4,6-dideoxygalactose transaminase